MKKIIVAVLFVASFSACDYKNASNGNIDEAFGRKEVSSENTESHHAVNHESEGEKSHEEMNTEKTHEEAAKEVMPADSAATKK